MFLLTLLAAYSFVKLCVFQLNVSHFWLTVLCSAYFALDNSSIGCPRQKQICEGLLLSIYRII